MNKNTSSTIFLTLNDSAASQVVGSADITFLEYYDYDSLAFKILIRVSNPTFHRPTQYTFFNNVLGKELFQLINFLHRLDLKKGYDSDCVGEKTKMLCMYNVYLYVAHEKNMLKISKCGEGQNSNLSQELNGQRGLSQDYNLVFSVQ